MLELLIGQDTAVITMLLLFITGVLTKRVVPWYVHEEALNKLKKYEDAAPGLIEEVNRLMAVLDEKDKTRKIPVSHAVRPKSRASVKGKIHE